MTEPSIVKGGSTLVMLANMARNNLCQLARAEGKELSPRDISDDNSNLKSAIIVNHFYARANEKVNQDPTHANLLEMNRFDELSNLLAASKATYDMYKKLQEEAINPKSKAIANHEQYERLVKEAEKQLEYLTNVLKMLAINIVNKRGITPEAEQQIKIALQENKKFLEQISVVTQGAEAAFTDLSKMKQRASKEAAERTLGVTPSSERPESS